MSTAQTTLKAHWEASKSTFFKKWAECFQNAEEMHIQIKNGEESNRDFQPARCSSMIIRLEQCQDRDSCDKNSDKRLHRPQVKL